MDMMSQERFPDSIGEVGFIQKDAPDYFPDWIERAELKKAGMTSSSPLPADQLARLTDVCKLV